MSYSFSVKGATRDEVIQKIKDEFDKVVAGQPIHAADRTQAEATANAFLGVLPEAGSLHDYSVSVNGSVSWTDNNAITGASVSVGAGFVAKVE